MGGKEGWKVQGVSQGGVADGWGVLRMVWFRGLTGILPCAAPGKDGQEGFDQVVSSAGAVCVSVLGARSEGDSGAALQRSAARQWEHASFAGMRRNSFRGWRRGAILSHPSRSAAGRATRAELLILQHPALPAGLYRGPAALRRALSKQRVKKATPLHSNAQATAAFTTNLLHPPTRPSPPMPAQLPCSHGHWHPSDHLHYMVPTPAPASCPQAAAAHAGLMAAAAVPAAGQAASWPPA